MNWDVCLLFLFSGRVYIDKIGIISSFKDVEEFASQATWSWNFSLKDGFNCVLWFYVLFIYHQNNP